MLSDGCSRPSYVETRSARVYAEPRGGDGDGMCLLAERLGLGRFVWPQAEGGSISLSAAQLSMLLDGIDQQRHRRWCLSLTGQLPLKALAAFTHSRAHDLAGTARRQCRSQRRGSALARGIKDCPADRGEAQGRGGLLAAHEVRPLQRAARARAA